MKKEDEVIISYNDKMYKQVYDEDLRWERTENCREKFRCPYCCFRGEKACCRPNPVFACDASHYWAELDKMGVSALVNTITDNQQRATRIEPDVNYTVIFKESGEDGKITAVQTGMRMPPGAKYICQDDAIHPHGSAVYFDYHELSDPQKIAYVCTDEFFYDFLKDHLVEDWD